MSSFTKNTSNLFLTIFIGLIVVSFLVTGYGTLQGTPDTVINVGGVPVKITEYQREYQRQLDFYKRIFGGKDLTTAQINQFKIKDNTIRNLVQRKLLVKVSDDIGVHPSDLQVKEEIKKLPYFQTNGAFDINKYKGILTANGYTPSEFEKTFRQDLKGQLANEVLTSYPASDAYFELLNKYKAQDVNTLFVSLDKNKLKEYVAVTNKEVSAFLAKSENKTRVNNIFIDRKSTLDVPAQVKASHILLRTEPGQDAKKVAEKAAKIRKEVSRSNFASKAEKYTEDPSGKGKGGDLGFFTKGRMVPEFEKKAFNMKKGEISEPIKTNFGYHIIYVTDKKEAKPATLAKHETTIAKELIRSSKSKEHQELISKVSSELESALKAGFSRVSRLEKSYSGAIEAKNDIGINRLEGAGAQVSLTPEYINSIFSNENKNHFKWDEAARVVFVKTLPKKVEKKEEESVKELEQTKKTTKLAWGRKLSEAALKELEENVKVTVNKNLLR